ncbi:hypothetical protein ACLOJK_001727 [Asimina triloba]
MEEVTSVEKVAVTPATPTTQQRRRLFLSNIDLTLTLVPYWESVMFFELPAKASLPDAFSNLRHALSHLLVPCYFVAGRLDYSSAEESESEGGGRRRRRQRLEIDCNDMGVDESSWLLPPRRARWVRWVTSGLQSPRTMSWPSWCGRRRNESYATSLSCLYR